MAGIFSRFIFNNAIFNTDGGESTGGVDSGIDYKQYRKRLEELSKISHERNTFRYKRTVKKLIKSVHKEKIIAPEIIEVVKQIELDFSLLDFTATNLKLVRLMELLNNLMLKEQQIALQLEIEAENEAIILLLA